MMEKIDFKNQVLLVVAPHPDDEVIGCGGLIAKVKKNGGKVYVLTITVGNQQQYGSVSDSKVRAEEFERVMGFLEVDGHDLVYADDKYHLRLDTIPLKELIDLIENKSKISINNIKPTIIAIPFGKGYFQDHSVVFKAAFAACRPKPKDLKHMINTVLVYDIPPDSWGTETFNPNFFVDISNEIEIKKKALSLYNSQSHPDPHLCSIENIERISKCRGSFIGVNAAEAFECLRNIV